MRVFVSLFIAFLLRNITIESTVDMSEEIFGYVSDHLTPGECRRLVACLYFLAEELPEVLQVAVEKVPLSVSCFDLLLNWNGGTEKWQGRGKTHVFVAHRLQQIGKPELAKELSLKVFHSLAENINKTILNYEFDNTSVKETHKRKLVKNKQLNKSNHWDVYNSLLWAALFSITGLVLFNFYRIIHLACRKMKMGSKPRAGELEYLLKDSYGSFEED